MTPRQVVDFERTHDAIWSAWDIGLPDLLILHARGVRRERRGGSTKAVVSVALGQGPQRATILAWDLITLERDRDRVHLANAAARDADVIDPRLVRDLLDSWTRRLWHRWLESIPIEETPGRADLPAVRWLLEPWIAECAGTILFAPPGTGKSYVALVMAVCLDAGLKRCPLGEVRRQAKVLYLNLERSRESMQSRLGRVNQALGLPMERPLRMLHARGATLADVADRVAATIADQGIEVVIVDSLSRAGAGSLIDDEVANTIVDTLNSWRIAWVGLAHTAKADAAEPKRQSVFGSQMQTAAADLVVRAVAAKEVTPSELVLALETVKANDTRTGVTRHVTLEFVAEGLARIRAATPEEVVDVAKRAERWQDALLALLSRGPMTIPEIHEAIEGTELTDKHRTTWRQRLKRLADRGVLVNLAPRAKEALWALAESRVTDVTGGVTRRGTGDGAATRDTSPSDATLSSSVESGPVTCHGLSRDGSREGPVTRDITGPSIRDVTRHGSGHDAPSRCVMPGCGAEAVTDDGLCERHAEELPWE